MIVMYFSFYVLLGAGYGGRGGQGSSVFRTGEAFGNLFEPMDVGCAGGDGTTTSSGGKGAGRIFLKVTSTLRNDGIIMANGAGGKSHNAGGGSGGSVWVDTFLIRVSNP